MTTEHRIEDTILRLRKCPKKTASNASITRKPFGDQSTKILSIPLFIDCYNQNNGGIDQANQLRAVYTTHFSRNWKEFFSEVFFAIDIAVVNSYKLNLALNESKISSTENRKSTQHREFIEELVNLLFCIEDDDFSDKITQKPYPKYEYQPVSIEPKFTEKRPFFENIHQFSQHSQIRNSAQKRGYCVICPLKHNSEPQEKEQKNQNRFQSILQLNNNLIEVEKSNTSRIRRNYTAWQCKECEEYICQIYWKSIHVNN